MSSRAKPKKSIVPQRAIALTPVTPVSGTSSPLDVARWASKRPDLTHSSAKVHSRYVMRIVAL
ncbi:MAG: hypothetical protein M3O36_05615 [Myxococcota bacterium]|nr:hypothetical protein [Myxococcota bacterium]